jgi:hypothetical protein
MQPTVIEPESNRLLGLAHIMRLAFVGDPLTEITSQLVKRIEANAEDASALLDMSVVFQLNSQRQLSLELQMEALRLQQVFHLRSNPQNPAIKLLAIMGPGEVMANTPIEFLVEDSDVALSYLYLGQGLAVPSEIPDHDLAFVAVCESDQNQALLGQLDEVMRYWPKPYINSPSRIANLSRNQVSTSATSPGCK